MKLIENSCFRVRYFARRRKILGTFTAVKVPRSRSPWACLAG